VSDQSSEILRVGDEKLYIDQVQPLEAFFKDYEMTPAKYWRLTALSSAENRGYCGTWEIKNNSLYLISIYAYRVVKKGFWFWKKVTYPEVNVSDLFPEAIDGEIKATWFSGVFRAYSKTLRNPVDDCLWVKFENGEVVSHRWFHVNGKTRKDDIPYEKPLP